MPFAEAVPAPLKVKLSLLFCTGGESASVHVSVPVVPLKLSAEGVGGMVSDISFLLSR